MAKLSGAVRGQRLAHTASGGGPGFNIQTPIKLLTVFVCPASVLQAMAVLVCAEMYQVKRLQHLCEVCVCAYLQSMPSRELASTGISVVRLLRRAKVSETLNI